MDKEQKMIEFFRNYKDNLDEYYSGQKWCEVRKSVCKCATPCWTNRYRTKYYNCTLNDTPTQDIDIKSLLEASTESLAKETVRSYVYLYNILDSLGIMTPEYLVTDEHDLVLTLLDNDTSSGSILNCLKLLSKWTVLLPIQLRQKLISFDTYLKVMALNNVATKYSTVLNKECINSDNWVTIDNIRTLLRKLKETDTRELYSALKLFVDYCPVRSDFGNVYVVENSESIKSSDNIKAYLDLEQMCMVFIERNKTKDYSVQNLEGVETYVLEYIRSRVGMRLFTASDFSRWFRDSLRSEFKKIGIDSKESIGVRTLRKIISNSIDYSENLDIYQKMGHTRDSHNSFYRK